MDVGPSFKWEQLKDYVMSGLEKAGGQLLTRQYSLLLLGRDGKSVPKNASADYPPISV